MRWLSVDAASPTAAIATWPTATGPTRGALAVYRCRARAMPSTLPHRLERAQSYDQRVTVLITARVARERTTCTRSGCGRLGSQAWKQGAGGRDYVAPRRR
jgi:hypothetical protein